MPALLPIGIYTIPEISFVGPDRGGADRRPASRTRSGVSRYRELARGPDRRRLARDAEAARSTGDLRLLGVHVFGTGATELVHIGQAVMALGGTVDYFVDNVFNYPTLAEAYKVAALNAMNKLRALAV